MGNAHSIATSFTMIAQLKDIFGSNAKAQEMILLLHDVKMVVRQGFYETELAAVETYCLEHNLYSILSRFKVCIDSEESAESGYSNKGLRLADNDERAGIFFI